MFDHVPPTTFWPLFFLAWFAGAMWATWLFSRWVDSHRPKRNRYVQGDHVAEHNRLIARNGFKSRIGAR
jgi:hypothetical protein